jgi:hypothetical protein
MKKYIFGGVAIGLIVAGIFYACKKNDTTGIDTESTVIEAGKHKDVYLGIVTIKFSQQGRGSGQNKYCVPAPGSCWLWFHNGIANDITMNNDVLMVNEMPTALVSTTNNTDENGSESSTIILDFKYQYNETAQLQELFTSDGWFVIEEDIIEGTDSPLLEIVGVADRGLQCTIPASSYPIIVYEEGIKVTLPVLY